MRWELLARFLSGTCSPAERTEIASWLEQSPRHHDILESLSRLVGDSDAVQLEAEWDRLRRALEGEGEDSDGNEP